MNYFQAIEQAKAGKKMLRPHWHWCWITWDIDKVRLIREDDDPGVPRTNYRPTKDDKKANDWQEYEE